MGTPASTRSIWAWRTLASNLSGSVSVGEPLVVHGRLKVREEERDGQWKTFVDIEAVAVGHDLSRGTAAFRRVIRAEPSLTRRPVRRTEHMAERAETGPQYPTIRQEPARTEASVP